jgi:hypothetical protein
MMITPCAPSPAEFRARAAADGIVTCVESPVVRSDGRQRIDSDWAFLKRWRRRLLGRGYRFADTGWFGLTPLRTHVAICGFGRSGTTLLLMMLEYALPHARRFGREMSAWRAATYKWRNHEVMLSKAPHDIFRLNGLFHFYRYRTARLRPIVMVRDPRDALTSRHAKFGFDRYCYALTLWKQYWEAVREWLTSPDVLVVRYEDLVSRTAEVQARVEAFTGEPAQRSFADFYKEHRPDFDTLPLNGVRPVDSDTVGRWQCSEHRDRLAQLERDEAVREALVALGYV